MAMIICPECSKEVSDRASVCPNCGYPINSSIHTDQEAQKVEVTAVKLGNAKTRKKLLLSLIISATLIAAAALIFITVRSANEKKAREAYIDNLNLAALTMLNGGAKAETVCNTTKSVWYNTIFEEEDATTDKYTKNMFGDFNSDFNHSISAFYADADTKSQLSYINVNRTEVETIMKTLQSPTPEFDECYDAVNNLYGAYYQLTSLAISPKGSLTTYSDDFSAADSEFIEHYDKIMLLLPEK